MIRATLNGVGGFRGAKAIITRKTLTSDFRVSVLFPSNNPAERAIDRFMTTLYTPTQLSRSYFADSNHFKFVH